MRLTFLKGIALGATIGAVSAAATVALASTLPFTLGTTNRVDAASTVTNTTPVAKPLVSLNNTTADAGASALALKVASGHAPFTTNSAQKVANLNADFLDGVDASSLQRRVTGTCPAGSAVGAVASSGTVTCQSTSNADTLDGIDSAGLIHGKGRIVTIDASVPYGDGDVFLEMPGLGRIGAECDTNGAPEYVFVSTPTTGYQLFFDDGRANPLSTTIAAGTASGGWAVNGAGDFATASLGGAAGRAATVFLFNYHVVNDFLHTAFCVFQGHAIINDDA